MTLIARKQTHADLENEILSYDFTLENRDAEIKRLRSAIEYAMDAPDDAKAVKTILFDALNGYDGQTDIDEFRATHGKYEG